MTEGRYEKPAGCYEFEAQLSAYLDGESRPVVSTHAKECAYCGPILADLELIRAESRGLALENPPATLWANIRAQLAAEGILREQVSGAQRWFERIRLLPNPAPIAALACLAIFASLFLIWPGASDLPRRASEPTEAAVAIVGPGVAAADVEPALARAVSEVETNYKAHEKSMAPAVKATYRKSLNSLDTSIRECLVSIHQEPTNTLAREYLVSAYTQKAEVLTAALEMDAR